MNRFDEDRVVFFLKHEEQIRAWAALEAEAIPLVNAFLHSLREDLEHLCHALGDDLRLHTDSGFPDWPMLALCRDSWRDAGDRPRVCIGLMWNAKRPSLAHGQRVFGGVRVSEGLAGALELRKRIAEAGSALRKARGYSSGNQWPASRSAPAAQGAYWLDLSAYRNVLLAEIETAWTLFSGIVDASVTELPSPI